MPDMIESYNHHGRIGVMVQFRCNDDFALKTTELQEVTKGIAVHIAAASPTVVDPSELSPKIRNDELADNVASAKELHAEARLKAISEANQRINEQHCLLSQRYVKDPERTVGELLEELSSTLGVNLTVVR
ncbi:MAG: hypothetical protein AAF446_02515, partial [Pseudomonadota bacterium]